MPESTAPFEWLPEHDIVLQKIASTDEVETDWDKLRSIVKHKIQQNISLFMSTTKPPPPPTPYPETVSENGGLKLPPFPPRKLGQLHVSDPPVCFMNDEQVASLKKIIFEQLDQFEDPPFTIQRLCELCIQPKTHYTSVGKYLRAVEKSILVTSSIDSFPPLTQAEIFSAGRSAITLGPTLQSAPSTPLFSPIPFLHEDARRSKSRSPPPTPFTLNPVVPLDEEPMEVKALGMVDEFDDPRPGHLSDHPTALTSVTTIPASSNSPASSGQTTSTSKPFFGTLEQRFVKAEDQMDTSTPPATPLTSTAEEAESDAMELDDDKENTKA
ncbi:PPP4R2-domain-containing protein [Crepidotus variabilis]|uniref:PPP4R2-domain-containing protein n=1 Tax=Crepidotus variabilis TaxID=179855 RepID=A0A9P6JVH6_9AGAR|nr:PPP4R2-domain-containing protein [Crepidotus variabilis]